MGSWETRLSRAGSVGKTHQKYTLGTEKSPYTRNDSKLTYICSELAQLD